MVGVKLYFVLALLSSFGEGYAFIQQWHGLTKDQLETAALEHKVHIKSLQAINRGGIVKKNLLNINCEEIDWTFYYQSPFLHMNLPKCGDVIQPRYAILVSPFKNELPPALRMLLLRPGKECQIDSYNLPNNATDECVEQLIWDDKVIGQKCRS